MNRHLVLITADFPCGTGETFLENEIDYLANAFEQVTIISQNTSNKLKRKVPSNCKVLYFDKKTSKKHKLSAVFNLFDKTFWQEWKIIRKTYKQNINKEIFFTMLISLMQGKRLSAFLQKTIKINKKTIFYSYWCDDAAIALALLKKQVPQIKAISRFHGWDVYFHVHKINYLPFRHLISNELDVIFSISEKGSKYAKEHWHLNQRQIQKIQVSELGVKTQVMIPNEERNSILVSCSNIIPVKRVHLIVEALQQITDISLKWVHFGDGIEFEKIKESVKQLPSNITYHFMGRIGNQEVLEWYQLNKPALFINVSSSEGIPVSVMEVMSLGIPVIATNVGGTSEIVNNENGYLLSSSPTPQKIAEQITRFFTMSDDEYKTYSAKAYETWNKKYNAEKNYTEFVDEFNKYFF